MSEKDIDDTAAWYYDSIVYPRKLKYSGVPNVDYDATYYYPGFYRTLDVARDVTEPEVAGFYFDYENVRSKYPTQPRTIHVRPDLTGVKATKARVHEAGHAQNNRLYLQNNDSEAVPATLRDDAGYYSSRGMREDIGLSKFDNDVLGTAYPGISEWERVTTNREISLTHALEYIRRYGKAPTEEELHNFQMNELTDAEIKKFYDTNGYTEQTILDYNGITLSTARARKHDIARRFAAEEYRKHYSELPVKTQKHLYNKAVENFKRSLKFPVNPECVRRANATIAQNRGKACYSAYEQGFLTKCAEYGIDGLSLLKMKIRITASGLEE